MYTVYILGANQINAGNHCLTLIACSGSVEYLMALLAAVHFGQSCEYLWIPD